MICLLHRWNIDRALDEGAEISTRTQVHVRDCHTCQRDFETQRRLLSRLEQPVATAAAPAFLRVRVMNAIRAGETNPVRPATRPLVWVPIAACAALVLFVFLNQPSRTLPLIPPPTAFTPGAVPLPAFHLPSVNVASALREAHNQIVLPYDQEIKNLRSDLQAAGDYLSNLAVWNLAKGN